MSNLLRSLAVEYNSGYQQQEIVFRKKWIKTLSRDENVSSNQAGRDARPTLPGATTLDSAELVAGCGCQKLEIIMLSSWPKKMKS